MRKKRLLVTGAGGYVGGSIVKKLGHKYDIVPLRRDNADLTSYDELYSFLIGLGNFDAVVHCAIRGGSRLQKDDSDVLYDNLTMFSNIIRFNHHFGKIINIGSGAEFDRRFDIAPNANRNTIPIDPYGMSKYFIAQYIRDTPNHYNMRIYGVFDENEEESRFIKTVIKNSLRGGLSNVSALDMSFIYMDDFIWMLEQVIEENTDEEREFDCVYPADTNPTRLIDIAEYIISTRYPDMGATYQITVPGGPTHYTGTPAAWVDYSKLIGLCGGIDRVYDILKSRMTWNE